MRQSLFPQKNVTTTTTTLSFRRYCTNNNQSNKVRNVSTSVFITNSKCGCGVIGDSTLPPFLPYNNNNNKCRSSSNRSFSVLSSISLNDSNGSIMNQSTSYLRYRSSSLQSSNSNNNSHNLNHQKINSWMMMLHNPRYISTGNHDNNHKNHDDSDNSSSDGEDSDN